MREVLFKRWIPKEVDQSSGVFQHPKKGTNCWESEFTHGGYFHQWANACEESSEGFGNYTVALIENPIDGTIESVLPSNVKFIS